MHNRSLLALSLTAGASLGLAACSDDPPAPDQVRARIAIDLAHILREGNAAVEGGTQGLPGAAAAGALDRVLGGTTDIVPRLRSALTPLMAPSRTKGARPVDGVYDPADDVAFLNDKLFTDANHQGDGIYAVPPSVVCARTTIDTNGNEVETIDATCADHLAAAQLRIRVSSSGDAIRFAIQLGAEHDEPLTIGLEPNALSVTLDLDDAWRAAVALAPLFGEELPNAELAGQISGRFEILGTAHAKASVEIDRDVAIAFADEGVALDGPDAFRFASAKAKVLALELDGTAQKGSFALGLGATTAHLADQAEAAPAPAPRHMDIDLPGMTAEATFGAGLPFELANISLGDRSTSVKIDGQRAVLIDLNADAGRAFGASLKLDASGRESISVSPKLDLRMAIDHSVLGDEPPVYDVTQLFLDGSVRADDLGDRLEVVSGTLRLGTSPSTYGFTATTGQCVRATEKEDLPSGQFYTAWAVGSCL